MQTLTGMIFLAGFCWRNPREQKKKKKFDLKKLLKTKDGQVVYPYFTAGKTRAAMRACEGKDWLTVSIILGFALWLPILRRLGGNEKRILSSRSKDKELLWSFDWVIRLLRADKKEDSFLSIRFPASLQASYLRQHLFYFSSSCCEFVSDLAVTKFPLALVSGVVGLRDALEDRVDL